MRSEREVRSLRDTLVKSINKPCTHDGNILATMLCVDSKSKLSALVSILSWSLGENEELASWVEHIAKIAAEPHEDDLERARRQPGRE